MPGENPTPVVEQDPAAGKAALESLQPVLMVIATTSLRSPNVDANEAALRALAVARTVAEPALRARFENLPASEFDPAHLDRLELAAKAVIYTRSELEKSEATTTRAQVPMALIERAFTTRNRMMSVLDYNLANDAGGQHADSLKELDHLRSGRGHLDLANDLRGVAELYVEHADLLASDNRAYDAADMKRAEKLAGEIEDHLGINRGWSGGGDREQAARAWTLLSETYEQVADTGRWLLRNDPRVKKLFPSLGANRKSRRAAASEPNSQ